MQFVIHLVLNVIHSILQTAAKLQKKATHSLCIYWALVLENIIYKIQNIKLVLVLFW